MKRALFLAALVAALLGLSASAIAGPYLPIFVGKHHIRKLVVQNRDVYDWYIHGCFHVNRSKVRCRVHVWASDNDGDYECNLMGQVRWARHDMMYTRTYGAHCYDA